MESKNPGEGGGASVCRRRVGVVASEGRRKTFDGTLVEILRFASEPPRCFLKEPRLISLESWLSFKERVLVDPGAGDFAPLAARSKHAWVGEGVKGGPWLGTGTRWKASWELISRMIASWRVSNVGWGVTAWVELYA
jgi:hypothetical protein